MLKQLLKLGLKVIGADPYKMLDPTYIALDKRHVLRTRNLRLIPSEENRRGGKHSYAEWAHVIGIFQTLMLLHLDAKKDNRILDVGCGTGLLAIASEPLVGEKGRYVGIDVLEPDIAFCRSHYPPSCEFVHLDAGNPAYAPSQEDEKVRWPVDDASFDLVTALSVWTHLNEEDAFFYMKEIARVLKPCGKGIITFFLLDDLYRESLKVRSNEPGRYHRTPQDQWVFDQPAYGSDAWFCPKWAEVPERAIGVTAAGFRGLLSAAGLKQTKHYPGNWKEIPGVFFQDVLVLEGA